MARLVSATAALIPPGIRVTGSNGKGSTARMAARIVSAHKLKCGLYTSPHLFSVNERFQINGTNISDDAFEQHLTTALDRSETIAPGDFCRFEILTAVAALWFAEQQVDAVVWEVGIGGRLDPTRIFPATTGVITQLALEHTNVLGADLQTIALDKADVVDVETPLVVGPLPPDIQDLLSSQRVTLTTSPIDCGLVGEHQRENAGCAFKAAQQLLGSRFQSDIAQTALLQCQWPLRMEQVCSDPPVWIDAAHNVSGLVRVAECLPEGPVVLVFGASEDRPYIEMARILADAADTFICTRATHKGTPPELISDALNRDTTVVDSVDEAVLTAMRLASDSNGSVLVTGGLFLAAEASLFLNGKQQQSLDFF